MPDAEVEVDPFIGEIIWVLLDAIRQRSVNPARETWNWIRSVHAAAADKPPPADERLGVTVTGAAILDVLSDGPATLTSISAQVMLRAHNTWKSLDALERGGYVEHVGPWWFTTEELSSE